MGGSGARLEVVAGKAMGMSILVDDELVVGRHAEGAGKLADDEEISRSHARVAVDRSGFCAVEDLGSTNGTFVNGLRITAPQTLSVGDTIELGATTLVVRELPSTESQEDLVREAPQQDLGPEAPHLRAVESRPAQQTVSQVTPAVAPAAAPEPTPAAPEPTPTTLSLQLEVDFAAREARLRLDDISEPLRLVFDGDAWRPVPSPSIEKGAPA